MMTMELPRRNASHQSTIKCSSCAAEIELSYITEHVCASNLPLSHHQQYHDPYRIPPIQSHYEQQPTETSTFRSHRPVLPKLDSSVHGRSGLKPSEAASIAHDLGLPSPLSAGGSSHRSRSKPRKPLIVRPPSPDVLISQDCAFPPFPLKPKRSQPEKESKTHRAQSNSRSTSSSKTGQHSSSLSTSSSVYSTGSGRTKRRTSNTSSSHRSRQGTVDDSISIPPTTPGSPYGPPYPSLSREQSMDQTPTLPALIPSDSYTSSAPSSSVSSMPPTPSWPPETKEAMPKIAQTPTSEGSWVPTERSIPEEHLPEVQSPEKLMSNRAQHDVFDRIVAPEHLTNNSPMFDNPPREPSYKTKRPAPLLQPKQLSIDDPGMPLSARLPPPPPPPGGLTRTLTNLFGRKRSKSTAASTMPLPSFDSPRMRALAPDPPDRPKRGDSLWDDVVTVQEPHNGWPTAFSSEQESSTANQATVTELTTQNTPNDCNVPRETGEFDFDFTEGQPAKARPEQDDATQDVDRDETSSMAPVIVNTQYGLSEQDLHRASIDSASSYGSIGFSTHRTGSSKSSQPTSSVDITGKPVPVVEIAPPPAPSQTIATVDFVRPERIQSRHAIPESPTDPFYHAGRLTPVPEAVSIDRYHPATPDQFSPTNVASPPQPHTRDNSRSTRPETPSGIKGKCRGCLKNIMTGQKSVASADGRLTGKYHKECFVCQTCKESFTTADFYVYEDHPYCSHHYHTLNNTLCTGCSKGIEGQYFETFDVAGTESKKFHPKCLQCSTCKVQLDEDYFEFHGRVYCERDAFRAASGPRKTYDTIPSRPSPLVREYINSEEPGLKGRFPERRTTKLIMT